MNEFQTLAADMQAALNQEMQTVLHYPSASANPFYGMMQYHMGWLDETLNPAHVHAGKQIRPVLLMLTCAAAHGRWPQAVPAAAAVELLHNFSLIHDDIEDASPTRRGRKTLWQIWGIEQAINAGDAMFAIAHLAMSRLSEQGVPAETVVQALRRFDETCVQLTQGQQADMAFEKQSQVSVADYLAMITGKTAVLLSLCTELGALIAGCDPTTTQHYAQFGLNLGLAFQVKDDILGIWGDETIIGKSAATDITTRKKTLPVLFGLTHSEPLRQLYQQPQNHDTFVQDVVAQLDLAGARDYAVAQASHYSEAALNHLHAANPTGPASPALHQLTDMLLTRNY
jgi:geranylgeranyl diphosphate synthase type I